MAPCFSNQIGIALNSYIQKGTDIEPNYTVSASQNIFQYQTSRGDLVLLN